MKYVNTEIPFGDLYVSKLLSEAEQELLHELSSLWKYRKLFIQYKYPIEGNEKEIKRVLRKLRPFSLHRKAEKK